LGPLEVGWKVFGELGILRAGQRRGTDVSVLKIGSRDGFLCFGGIQRFHADLRREFSWGNFKLDFFGVLGGGQRSATEEGGQLCVTFVHLEEFWRQLSWVL
jgi:hypothetical protein